MDEPTRRIFRTTLRAAIVGIVIAVSWAYLFKEFGITMPSTLAALLIAGAASIFL